MFISYYESPLGRMLLGSAEKELCGVWFENQKYYPDTSKDILEDTEVIKQTKQWLDIYFSGSEPSFMPSMLIEGTSFQKEVWEILMTIPYGFTMTYGDISKILAKKREIARMSSQAVGSAVGHNRFTILIPCHRVVGSDGSLVGYAGEIERKKKLLEMEQ